MKTSIFALGFILLFLFPSAEQDKYQQQREQLVNQHLIPRGIDHEPTLNAIRKVERHKMVPEEMVRYAYQDRPLPIGNGQTISQSFIVAYRT